ncbi:unnamed protein product [Thlaspi arvense]|uniref:V-ATPase proteolipid subunit C-like domain-containing protein n=1 Tax=Thlaspi arvense TaxID=13288 RepID=A0AAU9RYI7_THLAR|nr:unnamed protein product [Thlaspi arvense]
MGLRRVVLVALMGVMRPELVMKSIVPMVMAGVLGIYGLVISVIISTDINPKAKSHISRLVLLVVLLVSRLEWPLELANAQQPKLFVEKILILIFAEALSL